MKLKLNVFPCNILLLLFVTSFFIACDKHIVYEKFQTFPIEGWSKEDTLSFNIMVTDSMTSYKVFLEIRNRKDYPYQNLPLILYFNAPETNLTAADTLQLTLADKDGDWKGSGWGGLYQSSFRGSNMHINKAGSYQIKVVYLLPDNILSGINDVGIRLKKIDYSTKSMQ